MLQVNVREEQKSDINDVRNLIKEAFNGKHFSDGTESLVMDILREKGAAIISLVAEIDGIVIGQIAFSSIKIDGKESKWHVLGPISVLPSFQKKGIGKLMIEEGMKKLHELDSFGCVVEGDPNYYTRFGFSHSHNLKVADVSPQYVMAQIFKGDHPKGLVEFHEAFSSKYDD